MWIGRDKTNKEFVMGYYLQAPTHHGKADHICKTHNGTIIPQPIYFKDVPVNKGLICVVDNGPFEAAGFAYNENEFLAFSREDDYRPKTWLLIDRAKAEALSGF